MLKDHFVQDDHKEDLFICRIQPPGMLVRDSSQQSYVRRCFVISSPSCLNSSNNIHSLSHFSRILHVFVTALYEPDLKICYKSFTEGSFQGNKWLLYILPC